MAGCYWRYFTFEYTLIATRLGENERKGNATERKHYKNLLFFYYLKEIIWLIYFVILGAWSAIIGVFIFLIYGWWRLAWNRH